MLKPIVLCGVLIGLSAQAAYPCACCFDPGERRDVASSVDPFVLEDLDRLRLGPVATLFVTSCDIDCVQGLANPQYDYAISTQHDGLTWQITFASPDARGGSLQMQLDQIVHLFSTDFDPITGGPAPKLYKEWRFDVAVRGSGDFAAVTPDIPAQIVFSGFGNRCDMMEDFGHWRLQVQGGDVDFALFGAMAPPQ